MELISRIAFIFVLFVPACLAMADVTVDDLLAFKPDEDGNEVRDDVDAHIREVFAGDLYKVRVATYYARTLQALAQSGSNPDEARRLDLHLNAIELCTESSFEKSIGASVLPYVLNTYGVSISYLNSKMLWSQTLPPISDEEISRVIEEELAEVCR